MDVKEEPRDSPNSPEGEDRGGQVEQLPEEALAQQLPTAQVTTDEQTLRAGPAPQAPSDRLPQQSPMAQAAQRQMVQIQPVAPTWHIPVGPAIPVHQVAQAQLPLRVPIAQQVGTLHQLAAPQWVNQDYGFPANVMQQAPPPYQQMDDQLAAVHYLANWPHQVVHQQVPMWPVVGSWPPYQPPVLSPHLPVVQEDPRVSPLETHRGNPPIFVDLVDDPPIFVDLVDGAVDWPAIPGDGEQMQVSILPSTPRIATSLRWAAWGWRTNELIDYNEYYHIHMRFYTNADRTRWLCFRCHEQVGEGWYEESIHVVARRPVARWSAV